MIEIKKQNTEGILMDFINIQIEDFNIELCNYGASIRFLCYKGINTVLTHDNRADSINDPMYMGKTIGRFAGRIENAEYSIGETTYKLLKNDDKTILHGGFKGYSDLLFDYNIVEKPDIISVIFSLTLKNDSSGFNGAINLLIKYQITINGSIVVEYKYKSDEKTVVNITNHSYFNLGMTPTVNDLIISLNSISMYKNRFLIPYNEIKSIDLMNNILMSEFFLKFNGIVDDTFILKDSHCCCLINPINNIVLDVYTSYPSVVIYNSSFPDGKKLDHGGKMQQNAAITLECQYPPNEINFKNHQIKCLVEPNKWYTNYICYCFSSKEKKGE